MGVLDVFPLIMGNNKVESRYGIAMYYKKRVEPLLNRLAKIDGGASTSFGDDDASYGDDEDKKRLRIVEIYSHRRNGQSTVVREITVDCSCTGREDNAFVSRFLEVLEEVFDVNNYVVLSDKVRELRISFQDGEALEVRKAC